MKAKFRAWLIELVREAIRMERATSQTYTNVRMHKIEPFVTAKKEPSEAQPVSLEPSFEQMQAEALKAQEKYYEPA